LKYGNRVIDLDNGLAHDALMGHEGCMIRWADEASINLEL
jgi:hypothetical protein